MSVSGGREIKRATLNITVPTGVTDDVARLEAQEDREYLGAMWDADDTTGVEISFSSVNFHLEPPSGTFDSDEAESAVLDARVSAGGSGNQPAFQQNADWDSGTELHFHTENNSGSSNAMAVVVFYRER